MSADAPKVRLEQAWTWRCHGCGQRNYHDGEACTDPDMLAEAEELLEELNDRAGDEWKGEPDMEHAGEFVAAPTHVVCDVCGEGFAVDFGEDE